MTPTLKLGWVPNAKDGGNVVSFGRTGQWIGLKEMARSSVYSSDSTLCGKSWQWNWEGKQMQGTVEESDFLNNVLVWNKACGSVSRSSLHSRFMWRLPEDEDVNQCHGLSWVLLLLSACFLNYGQHKDVLTSPFVKHPSVECVYPDIRKVIFSTSIRCYVYVTVTVLVKWSICFTGNIWEHYKAKKCIVRVIVLWACGTTLCTPAGLSKSIAT